LEEKCNASQLLSYYQLKLSSELNFGQHPICQDTAADCNDRLKKLLQEYGKQMQVETHLARELTAHKLQAKLYNCANDFLEFGKDEWMRQCKQTSRFNILDQHFAVKCITEEPEAISDDDVPVELKTASRSNPDETNFLLVKMSTCLFSLAVNDSRRMIDKDIRTRRTQIISAKEREAKKKAVQQEVDMRADTIKPTDAVITLSHRFAKIEARLDELQAGTKAPTSDAAGMAESNEEEDEKQTTRRLEELEQRLRALETTGDTAKLHSSKNAMAADSAEQQRSANQQPRRWKRRKADTSSEAASTAAAPTRPNAIPSGAQTQAPRPTTPNNGNTKAKWNSSGQRGRGQNDGDKRRPHNHGQRQQSAERQPDQTQPQRGRGKGRGRGQGPARG
jgi:hypothetical protein